MQFLSILIDPSGGCGMRKALLKLRWAPSVRPTNTDGVNPDSTKHLLLEVSWKPLECRRIVAYLIRMHRVIGF